MLTAFQRRQHMQKNRILILGATGFVGGAIARQLVASGHEVVGLARTSAAADRLRSNGIASIEGDLDGDLLPILSAASTLDAVIYAAQLAPKLEHRAVSALLDQLADTGKRFIFTSGTGVFMQRSGGAWSLDSYAEDDPFEPEPLAAIRVQVEGLVRLSISRGVQGIVVRPPLIWGADDHGHVALTYRSVAVTGAACYVGDGLASYSNVHADDIARLFELVLEKGTPGTLYHGVGGEIPNRWIAEAVARDMGCTARSITSEEAERVWGPFGALIMSASSRSRSPRARDELSWTARHTDMLSMIGEPRLRRIATQGRV
jgi:nucleoside-diphosphate-sugar epimerase